MPIDLAAGKRTNLSGSAGMRRRSARRAGSRLSKLSRPVAASVSVLLAVVVVAIDLVTPVELNMAAFYFGPVAVAAWSLGSAAGSGFAALAAFMTYVNERWGDFPYSHPVYLYWAMGARFVSFYVVAQVFAKLRASYAEIEDLARIDPLTGVANRRGFYEESERALRMARRSSAPLSLLYLDIDDFKRVNDSVGHQAGDDLLSTVADQLSSTREIDTAARLGGDEFVVLMPDTGADAANEVVARLRQSLQAALAAKWTVTFSMGLITFLAPPASANEIIQRADDLMYLVKRETKNAVRTVVVDSAGADRLEAPT